MTYHTPTPAERQSSLGRCCIVGCHEPRRHRVVLVVRPPDLAGGFAEYHTPHATCEQHRESSWLSVDAVARASEQAIVRAAAEVAHGWPAAATLVSVSTRPLSIAARERTEG